MVGGALAALGLGAAAGEEAGAAGARKVTVCQGGVTKRVSAQAWRRMRAVGTEAYKGNCKPTTTQAPARTKAPDPKVCRKKHQACDDAGLRCCDFDPGTGEALVCDRTKKHRGCVAAGPPPPLGGGDPRASASTCPKTSTRSTGCRP